MLGRTRSTHFRQPSHQSDPLCAAPTSFQSSFQLLFLPTNQFTCDFESKINANAPRACGKAKHTNYKIRIKEQRVEAKILNSREEKKNFRNLILLLFSSVLLWIFIGFFFVCSLRSSSLSIQLKFVITINVFSKIFNNQEYIYKLPIIISSIAIIIFLG
jgi:hypothetical protein